MSYSSAVPCCAPSAGAMSYEGGLSAMPAPAENRSSTVVSVEEDAISYEQVARLCKKSAARLMNRAAVCAHWVYKGVVAVGHTTVLTAATAHFVTAVCLLVVVAALRMRHVV
eukprot:16005-Heterococcus_DN1.PRE.1